MHETSRLAVLALVLGLLAGGVQAAEPRPPFTAVSGIRIANYGAPSVLIEERERMRPLIEELNALRKKGSWARRDTTLACYSTLILMSGKKQVAQLRVRPTFLVERPVEKGESAYTLLLEGDETPRLGKLLAEIPPAKCPAAGAPSRL